jgi:hypothetical protein
VCAARLDHTKTSAPTSRGQSHLRYDISLNAACVYADNAIDIVPCRDRIEKAILGYPPSERSNKMHIAIECKLREDASADTACDAAGVFAFRDNVISAGDWILTSSN